MITEVELTMTHQEMNYEPHHTVGSEKDLKVRHRAISLPDRLDKIFSPNEMYDWPHESSGEEEDETTSEACSFETSFGDATVQSGSAHNDTVPYHSSEEEEEVDESEANSELVDPQSGQNELFQFSALVFMSVVAQKDEEIRNLRSQLGHVEPPREEPFSDISRVLDSKLLLDAIHRELMEDNEGRSYFRQYATQLKRAWDRMGPCETRALFKKQKNR